MQDARDRPTREARLHVAIASPPSNWFWDVDPQCVCVCVCVLKAAAIMDAGAAPVVDGRWQADESEASRRQSVVFFPVFFRHFYFWYLNPHRTRSDRRRGRLDDWITHTYRTLRTTRINITNILRIQLGTEPCIRPVRVHCRIRTRMCGGEECVAECEDLSYCHQMNRPGLHIMIGCLLYRVLE